MNTNIQDGDRHLRPLAYYALALLAGGIGLSASVVTAQMLAQAIQSAEPAGPARELLTWAAILFVASEMVASLIVGLVPVRRLRALRWQLTACTVALVAFEVASLFGARLMLARTADAQADARQVRVEQLRASIEASRRSAAALVEAGQRSSQSSLASSRADGAQSIRDAAAMEAATARLTAELAQLEAARTPTATAIFGEFGVIMLAVAQAVLTSVIGLAFAGAAGGLARAARDARAATSAENSTDVRFCTSTDAVATPAPPTATLAENPADVPATPRRAPLAVEQLQAVPTGAVAAVPSWGRYAFPASAIAAGAGLVAMAPSQASAAQVEVATPAAAAVDTPEEAKKKARRAATPRAVSVRDTGVGEGDGARFLRVREGVEAGRIKPSVRAIYAAEGASQAVAKRYLLALEQAGVIEVAGQGKGYRLRTA